MEEIKEVKKEKIITIKIKDETLDLHLGFRDYITLEHLLDIPIFQLASLVAKKGLTIIQVSTILSTALKNKYSKDEIETLIENKELDYIDATSAATSLMLKIITDQMDVSIDRFKKKKTGPKLKIPKKK